MAYNIGENWELYFEKYNLMYSPEPFEIYFSFNHKVKLFCRIFSSYHYFIREKINMKELTIWHSKWLNDAKILLFFVVIVTVTVSCNIIFEF